MPREPLIELVDVSHRYGNVRALRSVTMSLFPREIVGLVGDNSGGKSTLIRILGGLERPSSGNILWKGEPASYPSISRAHSRGIYTVFKNSRVCPNLTVAANIYLGKESMRGGFIDESRMTVGARQILHMLGSPLSPDQSVGDLSDSEQQTVLIAQALLRDPEVLLLDEPTSSLSRLQTLEVLNQLRHLRSLGKTVVFVGKDLLDVFALSDRICVLRNGSVCGVYSTRDTSYEAVLAKMAGVA